MQNGTSTINILHTSTRSDGFNNIIYGYHHVQIHRNIVDKGMVRVAGGSRHEHLDEPPIPHSDM